MLSPSGTFNDESAGSMSALTTPILMGVMLTSPLFMPPKAK